MSIVITSCSFQFLVIRGECGTSFIQSESLFCAYYLFIADCVSHLVTSFRVVVFMLPDLEDRNFYIQEKGTEALMISTENSCFACSHYSNVSVLHNTHNTLSSQIYCL